MPAKSIAQQHLFQAAEHGADFPMANKLRESASPEQLHDFSVGSEAGKPQHVLKGDSKDIIDTNAKTFRNNGLSEHDALKKSLKHASRHKNLGKFLHPRKDGKTHGSE